MFRVQVTEKLLESLVVCATLDLRGLAETPWTCSRAQLFQRWLAHWRVGQTQAAVLNAVTALRHLALDLQAMIAQGENTERIPEQDNRRTEFEGFLLGWL